MSELHPKQTLGKQPDYQDPASKQRFKVGDEVRYCPESQQVFLEKSLSSYDGKCPYCGFQIIPPIYTSSPPIEKPPQPALAPSTAPEFLWGAFFVLILFVGTVLWFNGINGSLRSTLIPTHKTVNPPDIFFTPTPSPTVTPTAITAETPTPYPTSTNVPTNTKEPFPTSTKGPTSPVIDLIDFAPKIICDGRRYDVPIHFHDADGDAQDIFWELVYSKKGTTLYSTRRNLEISGSAQIKGAIFNDWIEWNKAKDEVKIRVIITDSTGLSGWKEFEFSCSK